MHKESWSDLEYVLAVARAGSAAAAARVLKVNHATVIRRIQAFEARLPEPIFEHRRTGYSLTKKGEAFLEAAHSIEEILADLDRKMVGGEQRLSGNVRVTTTDSFAQILVQEVPRFRELYPGITLDLSVGNHRLDLSNRAADIALRPSNSPPPELVGRKVGRLRFGIYFFRPLAHGEALLDLPWLGLDTVISDSAAGKIMTSFIEPFDIVGRADSFISLKLMAEARLGAVFLPRHLGDASTQLVSIPYRFDSLDTDIWLLAHKDILRAQRVRVCMDFLYSALKARCSEP